MTLTPLASNNALDDDPRRYAHLSTIRLEDPDAIARAPTQQRTHPRRQAPPLRWHVHPGQARDGGIGDDGGARCGSSA